MVDRVGQQLGNYRLVHLLGRGNFADVYLAQHIHLNTQAAIKVLHGRLADHDLESFLNEARTIAHLRHPHIIQVLEFGVEDTIPFLVMDYAPNGNLRQRHPKGTQLPLDTVVSYVKQVADALQYAHSEKLIHRDIKPENMLLGRNNEILLSDFGIAIIAQNSRSQPGQDTAGTIPYMAPEQFQAHPGFASDQYALGIVVYEWLSGDRPFHGSFPEIATKHSLIPPPSLSEKVSTIPPAVEHVVLKALAKDPRQRFENVQAFAIALEEASRTESSGQTLTHFNNLPAQLTSFIGREQEVAAVYALLQRTNVRLVTLTGTGGIGKTRLALQVATELPDTFADGVYFVPLAPISDPALVVPTIAHSLGLKHAPTAPHTAMAHMEYLKTSLQDKRCLLLLDNFEQVVTAAPDLTELLTACPHLKILVTSRAVLHVNGEFEFPVPPLAFPERTHLPPTEAFTQYAAVALFLQRAQAIMPDFAITEANADTIAAICRHLDGLPLAIELAAARIKLLPPRALLRRLTHRLEVLTSGVRDVPARQQTLRNTLAWSYHLLDAAEQRLFRRLSVFVDGCTLEAIEFICGIFHDGPAQVLDSAASLIDKSLLQQTEREGEEPRFVMLETIREYGLECLTMNGEEETARLAHAEYYLALAEKAEPELGGPRQAVWLERLEREHDNLRMALGWLVEQGEARHDMTMALRLGGALQQFWIVHGPFSEGRNFLERALAASAGVEASVRAKALVVAANLAFIQSDFDRAEALCQESLALYRELGNQPGIAYSLYLLAWAARDKVNIAQAYSMTGEALALFRELGDKEHIAWSLYTLAFLDSNQGEYARAFALLEESLALHRELGHKRGIAFSLVLLARTLFVSQTNRATLHSPLEQGLALFRELGDKDGIAYSLTLSGQIALNQGDAVTARSLLEESVLLYREMGSQQGIAESLPWLARIVTAQGDEAAAYALYQESLTLARELNRRELIAFCLEGLAVVVTIQGDFLQAAKLWGEADALREAVGVPIPPVERTDYERSVAAARTQLGEEAFATAWTQGRAIALEHAIATRSSEMPSVPAATVITPPPTYPAGLTSREVEVLRLVARGLTNTEIAQELGLSEKTIAHHLTHIFNKTTSENRAAAVAFAFRHGLA